MKKIFSVENNSRTFDAVLLILRISVAVLMLTHGIPKLTNLLSDNPQFVGVLGMSPETSLALAVFAEVVCSMLILVGFGTRLATIPLIITMLIAVFMIHAEDPFAKQEMGLHYLVAYIVLLIAGSGQYSVDAIITKNRAELEPARMKNK